MGEDDATHAYAIGQADRIGGRLSEAVAHFQRALQLNPNYAEAYDGLAQALVALGRGDEAVLCCRQALRLKPDFADAHKHLGDLLRDRTRTPLDEAIASYREAVRFAPNDASAHNKLGHTLRRVGRLDDAIAAFRRACELRPDSAKYHSNLLYCLHFHADYDAASLGREHARWNEQHAEPLAPLRRYPNAPDPDRCLRIGFVSTNFRFHPVSRFLLPLFTAPNRGDVEFFCYASVARPDEMTGRFRAASDGWRDVAGVTDEGLADLVRQDRIDVLVDLDCHMVKNRLLAFARKPAPVQVTYLAYCSTTGLRAMDYRLTDPFLDAADAPQCYSEESISLAETYWCYEPMPGLPPVGPLPARATGHVTFGSLNSFCKVSLGTMRAWRDVFQQVPGARLVLHASPGSHRDVVRGVFADGGVDPARVEFVGLCPPAQHFRRYQAVDIGLDPFPYAGGTTTCDALWMGVPVVSLAGTTAVGRGGVSILSNVGLPGLVAHTVEEYVRLCVDLALDLPRLEALRSGMRERMTASPLMNAPRFAGHMEAAFREMWRRWCRTQTAPGVETGAEAHARPAGAR